jgi:uncharacterized SAM-binding protein YcdF (DUF218 family)
MRFASLVWLLFSIGGLLIVLAATCIWILVRPGARAGRVWLVAVVTVYAALSTFPIPRGISHWWARGFSPLTRDHVPPGPVLEVLLGSGSYTAIDWTNGRTAVPDPIGLQRTLEAARVYRLVGPVWVISSGGPADAESVGVPPGQTMRDALVELGVPASRIIVRDEALDTHDEAQGVKALLPSLHVNHVVLVTSGVHMRRAVAVFRGAGIEVIPAPARDDWPGTLNWRTRWLPSEPGMYEAALVAQEILGFAYYRVRGWRD